MMSPSWPLATPAPLDVVNALAPLVLPALMDTLSSPLTPLAKNFPVPSQDVPSVTPKALASLAPTHIPCTLLRPTPVLHLALLITVLNARQVVRSASSVHQAILLTVGMVVVVFSKYRTA